MSLRPLNGPTFITSSPVPSVKQFQHKPSACISTELILFSFREMYESLKIIIKNPQVTFLITMLLGIILWEITNLLNYSWIYTIPYITYEIAKINIVVIAGWSILIGLPVYIYNKYFPNKNIKSIAIFSPLIISKTNTN